MSSVSKVVFGILLICSLCTSVWAQATAQINGAVKDQNLVNPNPPTASMTSTLFGKVTSAGDPRILQFAFKYVF